MAGVPLIVDADRELVAWLERIGVELPITLEAPGVTSRDERGRLHAYLLGFANARAARATDATPMRVGLRYLVTTTGGDIEHAHAALSTAVFAALGRDDIEVDLEAPTMELWSSLGIAPRPAFIVRTSVSLTPKPVIERRIETVHARIAPSIVLTGSVLGPGDIPVVGAILELPSLGQVARSDERGCFRFPQCPTDPAPARIRVAARGLSEEFAIPQPITGDRPIVVRVEMGRNE